MSSISGVYVFNKKVWVEWTIELCEWGWRYIAFRYILQNFKLLSIPLLPPKLWQRIWFGYRAGQGDWQLVENITVTQFPALAHCFTCSNKDTALTAIYEAGHHAFTFQPNLTFWRGSPAFKIVFLTNSQKSLIFVIISQKNTSLSHPEEWTWTF